MSRSYFRGRKRFEAFEKRTPASKNFYFFFTFWQSFVKDCDTVKWCVTFSLFHALIENKSRGIWSQPLCFWLSHYLGAWNRPCSNHVEIKWRIKNTRWIKPAEPSELYIVLLYALFWIKILVVSVLFWPICGNSKLIFFLPSPLPWLFTYSYTDLSSFICRLISSFFARFSVWKWMLQTKLTTTANRVFLFWKIADLSLREKKQLLKRLCV